MTFSARHQGFTLVELAISLMIIGLLIGGILKGDELIENAKSVQYVRQLKDYTTAANAFKVAYDSLPGDMMNASARIPNCASAPCSSFNAGTVGDDFIATEANVIPAPRFFADIGHPTHVELRNFYVHMVKAGLLTTGIQPNFDNGGSFSGKLGVEAPAMPDSDVGVYVTKFETNPSWGDPIEAGNFFQISPILHTDYALMGSRALYIDQKLDDGLPGKGDVRAGGIFNNGTPTANCVSSTTAYNTQAKLPACNLFFRLIIN